MNAITMLRKQHREVAALFKQLEKAKSAAPRRSVFEKIADALMVHTTIEERHFYPAIMQKQTEDLPQDALEEHLMIKRVIADMLALDADDDEFQAKATVLREDVEHHVEEEESELFPKVEELLDEEELESIAAAMEETQEELLREGDPRDVIPAETEQAALF